MMSSIVVRLTYVIIVLLIHTPVLYVKILNTKHRIKWHKTELNTILNKINGKWDKYNGILAITWLFSKGLNRFLHDPMHVYTDGLVLFIDSVIWSIKFLELFQRILINYVLLCKLYQTDFVIIHTKMVSGEGIEIAYKAYL